MLVALGVGVAFAVSATVVGWKLPSALDRSDRAAEVIALRTSLAGIKAQTDLLAGEVVAAQGQVQDVSSAITVADEAIRSQEERITDLQATIAKLKKEIAAVGT
jgi:peptidoglycan hydrolase CwlO-like protein